MNCFVLRLIASGLMVTLLSGCGSSTSVTISDISTTLSGLRSRLKRVGPRTDYLTNPATGAMLRAIYPEDSRASLAAIWTAGNFINNLFGSSAPALTPKAYIGEALNPDFLDASNSQSQFFGRILSPIPALCSLGLILPEAADGEPAEGLYPSLTIPAGDPRFPEQCGYSPKADVIFSVNLTRPSERDPLIRQFVISSAGLPTVTLLYRNGSDGSVDLSFFEDTRPANGTRGGQGLYRYDGTKKTLRVQYLSGNFAQGSLGSYEFYRLLGDDSSQNGYLVGYSGLGDGSSFVQYAVAGKYRDTGQLATGSLALSLSYKGQPGSDQLGDNNACLGYDGSIVSDGSLACSVTGPPISSASAILRLAPRLTAVDSFAVSIDSEIPFTNPSDLLSVF